MTQKKLVIYRDWTVYVYDPLASRYKIMTYFLTEKDAIDLQQEYEYIRGWESVVEKYEHCDGDDIKIAGQYSGEYKIVKDYTFTPTS